MVSRDDSVPEDSALYKQHVLITESCAKINRRVDPGKILKEIVQGAGLTNIVEFKLPVPIGTWAKDKKYKEIGRLNWHALYDGLDAITMRPLTQLAGWQPEDVKKLLDDCRKELFDKSIHAEYT